MPYSTPAMSTESVSSGILHPFWDRSIRFLLRRPAHLKAIISLCQPELAGRLDFNRLETIDRSFILDDYRQREADLLVRVPYQSAAGQQDVIVYVLLEHQSTIDPWMPFRLLFYMLQIWEDERKRVQATGAGAPSVRLSPIVPAVFYTGSGPWSASRELQALVNGPEELRPFVPRFDILYVGLPETDPAKLEAIGPLGWALRAVQRVEADHPEFKAVLERAAHALQPLRPLLPDQWRELARFLMLLITHRRPDELEDLQEALQAAGRDSDAQTELMTMSKSIAQIWLEEGIEKGIEKGIQKGIEQGRGALRRTILTLGRRQFGEPSTSQLARLNAIAELSALESMSEAIPDAQGWDDLLGRSLT